jgi:hypothetical protein
VKLIRQLGKDTLRHETGMTVQGNRMKKLGMVLLLGGTTPSLINVAQLAESGSKIGPALFTRNLTGLSGKASRSTARQLTMLWPLGP